MDLKLIFLIMIIIETLTIGVLLWLLFRSYRYTSKFIKKAQLLKDRCIDFDDIETADLSIRSQKILAEAVNSIKNNMQTFLEATKENVVVLSDAIEVINSNADNNRLGSRKIADSLSVVAEKVEEQLEIVRSNLALIEDNATKILAIDEAAREIGERINDTVQDSKSGLDSIIRCEKNMSSVSEKLAESEQILLDFTSRIHEINEIGAFITEISDSLELLSLNASIEAARAGEAGKGFVVVAGEVSKMADKTSESISSINSILDSIISSSEAVKEGIQESVEVFAKSSRDFEQVSTSFRSIDKQSAHINDMMKSIYLKIEDITSNSKESRIQADRAFKASEQVVIGTQDIARVSDETAAASKQMSENIDSLDSMLMSIKNLLQQYNTSVVPVKQTPMKKVKIGIYCILDNDFWHEVRRGIIYAKNVLEAIGAEVRYIPFENWDLVANLPAEFKKMQDEGFDGYICPGFMTDRGADLSLARAQGKKVFVFNCDSPDESCRDAVFQPDTYDAGITAAKEMAKAVHNDGKIIILCGDEKILVNKIRRDSFLKQASQQKGMDIVETVFIEDNEDDTYNKAVEAINRHPEVNGIFITTGTPLAAARAIEDSGRSISLVVFDHSQEIFRYIRKGIISAALGQDPFGQGHDPIIYMYNCIVTGEPLPTDNMKLRVNVVDRDNVESLIQM
ncbi:MAG: substrate-binding domain-containing protein [Lachnospiraceae bacterium]|nr:substrate-binding domain-containing protein [Lachnospiraceae bacterium]